MSVLERMVFPGKDTDMREDSELPQVEKLVTGEPTPTPARPISRTPCPWPSYATASPRKEQNQNEEELREVG